VIVQEATSASKMEPATNLVQVMMAMNVEVANIAICKTQKIEQAYGLKVLIYLIIGEQRLASQHVT
jgi:hypothetical protein